MDNNLILNSSAWDYANLAKSAGVTFGATVGIAMYSGMLKWLS